MAIAGEPEALGSIHPFQGNFNSAASNCFSSILQEHIYTDNSMSFEYFVDEAGVECETPLESTYGTNNYSITLAEEGVVSACTLFTYDYGEGQFTYGDYIDIKTDYLNLKSQFTSTPNNELFEQLLQKEEEKDQIVSWFIRDAINNGNVYAESVLNTENTEYAKRLKYGLRVQLNDYIGAINLLDSLSTLTKDDQWFIKVQEINLERLTNPMNFELSFSQDSLLNLIANNQSTSQGNARALLTILKDEQFLPEIEFGERSLISNYNSTPKDNDTTIKLQPNPAQNELTLIVPERLSGTTYIRLFEINGDLVKSFELQDVSQKSISLDGISNGFYTIIVKNEKKSFPPCKLIVLK